MFGAVRAVAACLQGMRIPLSLISFFAIANAGFPKGVASIRQRDCKKSPRCYWQSIHNGAQGQKMMETVPGFATRRYTIRESGNWPDIVG